MSVVHARIGMLVAATACWGAGTVVSKHLLGSVEPLTLLPVQLAASCLFLLAAVSLGTARVARPRHAAWFAALGMLNPGLAYALGLLGLTSVTASMSVLLWAVEPVLILVLAAGLLRERVPLAVAAAVGSAVIGVVFVVYRPGATGDAAGVALTLAAVGACALYTILTRRLSFDDASLTVVLVQQIAALGFAVVLATVWQAAGGVGWSTASMTAGTWFGAAASGVLYYGAAFWFYLAGLRAGPAWAAGGLLPLVPVFGLAFASLAGERLELRQWLGAALVIAATLGVSMRRGPGRRDEPAHRSP
ncbi:DMT family transporter [Mangrovihabitans endophyticus]|nr:DMT family transporter [Mangrovihabitans endophyticus]